MKNHSELLRQNVGVDVSKDTLDVAFSTIDMQQHVKVKASRSLLIRQLDLISSKNRWKVNVLKMWNCAS